MMSGGDVKTNAQRTNNHRIRVVRVEGCVM
jgi:hypothetical protein